MIIMELLTEQEQAELREKKRITIRRGHHEYVLRKGVQLRRNGACRCIHLDSQVAHKLGAGDVRLISLVLACKASPDWVDGTAGRSL